MVNLHDTKWKTKFKSCVRIWKHQIRKGTGGYWSNWREKQLDTCFLFTEIIKKGSNWNLLWLHKLIKMDLKISIGLAKKI